MRLSNVEGMTTTSAILQHQRESTSRVQVPCPDVIKMYKQLMGGVDLDEQRTAAYQFDR